MSTEVQPTLRIVNVLLTLISFLFSKVVFADASTIVSTSLVPLHRQLLQDIEQLESSTTDLSLPTNIDHSHLEEARNVDRIIREESSIISDEFSHLLSIAEWVELKADGLSGIPLTRRGHSSTIYTADSISEDDAVANQTTPDVHLDYPQEYMIISGGFTSKDWTTFPVWEYDVTSALGKKGKWKQLDVLTHTSAHDETSEEQACVGLNEIVSSDDLKDMHDLWSKAMNCPPQSRYGHMSLAINGYLYVFGGLLYHQRSGVFAMEDQLYMYRLNLSKLTAWERIVPRVKPPFTQFVGIIDDDFDQTDKYRNIVNRGEVRGGYWDEEDKLVIYGGLHVRDYTIQSGRKQQEDTTLGDVWAYDFKSDTWEMMAPSQELMINDDEIEYSNQYPESRTSHAATIVGNELIICGGLKKVETFVYDGTTVWEQLTDVWIFDLKTRLWRERNMSKSIGRSHHSLVGWKDTKGSGGAVIASFGGFKTVYDVMSSVPRPITYVYDDTLISYPSETNYNWLEVAVDVCTRPLSRREHSAVLSKNGNMLIWGGRLQSTEDDLGDVWSLDMKSVLAYEARDEEDESEALEEFYLLVTTIFFISMMFTYMCGTLARYSGNDTNDGTMDHSDTFPGFDSSTNPFGRSNGLGQDIIDTLPLKIYRSNDADVGDEIPSNRDENESDRNGDNNSEDENVCAICLVRYKDGDELRSLPCGHVFHKSCNDSWLLNNASCPSCRYSLQHLTGLTVDSSHPMSWARISNLTSLGTNSVENDTETRRGQNSYHSHVARLFPFMGRFRSYRHGAEILTNNSDTSREERENPAHSIEDSNSSNDLAHYSSSIEMTENMLSRSRLNEIESISNERSPRIGLEHVRQSRAMLEDQIRVVNATLPLNERSRNTGTIV